MIHEIQGKQVLLDNDVAKLCAYETKVINQTVKRNIKRFPKEFCFQLSEKEYNNLLLSFDSLPQIIDDSKPNLRSQFVTSNNYGGRRYLLLSLLKKESLC